MPSSQSPLFLCKVNAILRKVRRTYGKNMYMSIGDGKSVRVAREKNAAVMLKDVYGFGLFFGGGVAGVCFRA